ncbi:hypothetical protein EON79_06530 [bacterium]|nr:MAG: hypothetical protein EON79_06530 [bacterium]
MSTQHEKTEAGTKLVTEFRLKAGSEAAFADWLPSYVAALEAAPGFLGRETASPIAGDDAWSFVVDFQSREAMRGWKESAVRGQRIDAVRPLLQPDGFAEVSSHEVGSAFGANSVTEVILDRVQPGQEPAYRDWSSRVQQAQVKFEGYQGGYTQRTSEDGLGWMTIMRFVSPDDLHRWMRSPERTALMAEGKGLVTESYQHQVDSSFPGWTPSDPDTGEAPPNWKTTMLVLLGLYPIVGLEIAYLMQTMAGLPHSLSGFIGNAISVVLVAFGTMPFLVRWMGWWLFPKSDSRQSVTLRGTALIVCLYIIEIVLFGMIL